MRGRDDGDGGWEGVAEGAIVCFCVCVWYDGEFGEVMLFAEK